MVHWMFRAASAQASEPSACILDWTHAPLDSFALATLSWVEYDQVETLSAGPLDPGDILFVEIDVAMNAWDGNFNSLDVNEFTYSEPVLGVSGGILIHLIPGHAF